VPGEKFLEIKVPFRWEKFRNSFLISGLVWCYLNIHLEAEGN